MSESNSLPSRPREEDLRELEEFREKGLHLDSDALIVTVDELPDFPPREDTEQTEE